MTPADEGAGSSPLDLVTAVRRFEPALREFIAGQLAFADFEATFEAQYQRDVDSYDARAGDVVGVFFTDCDQTSETPDPKFFELTVDEFRARGRALLALAGLSPA